MACCGLVAAVIVTLLDPLLARVFDPMAERLALLRPMLLFWSLAVLVGASCWAAGRRRWRGFWGLSRWRSYPPLWTAVVFAILCWVLGQYLIASPTPLESHRNAIAEFVQQFNWASRWFALLTIIALIAAPELLRWWSVRRDIKVRPKAAEYGPSRLAKNFEDLRAWLKSDDEIDSDRDDLFGHAFVADRIAGRLAADGEAPTMAVVGSVGSGKSTIRELVRQRLVSKSHLGFVSISLWPFDSPEAAVRGILQSLVRQLSKHVNVLPLVGLSDDYVMAIERTGGMYGGFARLLRGTSDPNAIVDRLSNIARAAGIKLVIWVDDLERFSGGDALRDEARHERENERLGPVRALLHLLDRAPNISLVTADTSLRTRFDLHKIARHVELVPEMSVVDAWQAVKLVRDKCLGGYPVPVIDPASPKARKVMDLPSFARLAQDSAYFDEHPDVPMACARLLATPRNLKAAVRTTLDIWETMPGELDFDAVLATSVIRVARPDVFEFILDNIAWLRTPEQRDSTTTKDSARSRVSARLHGLLDPKVDHDATAVKKVMAYLFPLFRFDGVPADVAESERHQPQAFGQKKPLDSPVDHWRRYLSQAPVSEAERDQLALASIANWQAGKPSDLLDRLMSDSQATHVGTFSGQFRPSELCKLLVDVADHLAARNDHAWTQHGNIPGVPTVFHMMHKRRPESSDIREAALDCVRRYAATHLPLTQGIAYWFGSRPDLLIHGDRQQLHRALHTALIQHFTGHGGAERLAAALRGGSPYTVHWASWGLDRISENDFTGLPMPGWANLAHTLLDLAASQPAIGLPLIVPFVASRSPGWNRSRGEHPGDPSPDDIVEGEWDVELARRLFDFDRLITLLAAWDVPRDLEPQFRASCVAAVEGARRARQSRS